MALPPHFWGGFFASIIQMSPDFKVGFGIALILVVLIAIFTRKPTPKPIDVPPPTVQKSFNPPKPKIKEIGVRLEDPHFCKKPDDAYLANNGRSAPQPAGSGQFHDPVFQFDALHRDNKVTWADDFKGSVIVCFVVNTKGETEHITFPQSPGEEMEKNIKDFISSARYKPGWFTESWADKTPHIVPTQIALDLIFP